MRVCTPITVRYAETDKMAVVYHANYLLYLEDARTHFLEELGYPYKLIEDAGYISPVLNVNINYGKSLRYGDVAIVRTWISKSTPMRTTYSYEVFVQGQDIEHDKPYCTAQTTHCLVDEKTFKPASIKRATPKLYELYEQVCVR